MVARLGAAQASKPMPVKVRGPETVLTVAAAGLASAAALGSAGAGAGAGTLEEPTGPAVPEGLDVLGALDEPVVASLVLAVARTSSTCDSLAPQAASTWTSVAVKRAALVRADGFFPVRALREPTALVLDVIAVALGSEAGCSQMVSARPTLWAGQSCWLPARPR